MLSLLILCMLILFPLCDRAQGITHDDSLRMQTDSLVNSLRSQVQELEMQTAFARILLPKLSVRRASTLCAR